MGVVKVGSRRSGVRGSRRCVVYKCICEICDEEEEDSERAVAAPVVKMVVVESEKEEVVSEIEGGGGGGAWNQDNAWRWMC